MAHPVAWIRGGRTTDGNARRGGSIESEGAETIFSAASKTLHGNHPQSDCRNAWSLPP